MSAYKNSILVALLALMVVVGCTPQSGPRADLELTDIPQYGKFIWHDLITDDVDAAQAFYGPLMGWTFEQTQRPGGGPYTLIRSVAGEYVGGIVELEDPADGTDYSRWLGYYAVPAVDEAVEATLEAGGQVVVSARNLASVARVAAVRDPDGAVIGLVNSRVGYPLDRPVIGNGEIVWNELLTASPAKTAAFYAALASGSVRDSARDYDEYHLLEDAGQARAGIMLRPDPQVDPVWLTYFATGDASSAAGKAAALGGKVILEPQMEVRQGTITLLEDPTGAVFGMQQQTKGAN